MSPLIDATDPSREGLESAERLVLGLEVAAERNGRAKHRIEHDRSDLLIVLQNKDSLQRFVYVPTIGLVPVSREEAVVLVAAGKKRWNTRRGEAATR